MVTGQDMASMLQSIETHNTRLATLRSENKATMSQLDSETSIVGPTSVEYSPFWGGAASGIASSELVVRQEFDFPTLGGMRRESGAAQGRVLDLQYQLERRDILLDAKKLCYDLWGKMLTIELLHKRELTSDSLLVAYETSLKHGNATIIDVNRIKMDRMMVHTQLTQVQGEALVLKAQLQSLNGGVPIDGIDNSALWHTTEPLASGNAIALEENVALAAVNATAHEVKLARRAWLPSLSVGYRRNTEVHEAVNGFVVGVSMPLFGNSKKVKAAQARQQAAQAQAHDAHTQAANRDRQLQAQAQQLHAQISAYDMPLLQSTLALINKAIGAGALTVVDYYNQADRIYTAMQELIDLRTQHNKVMSDLNRHTL